MSASAATIRWQFPVEPLPRIDPRRHTFAAPDRPSHRGLDLVGTYNTPVVACASGVVRVVDRVDDSDFGYYVKIQHDDGIWAWYAHLNEPSELSVGQRIARGEYIGPMGRSGNATGVHVHLELSTTSSQANSFDPRPYIDARTSGGLRFTDVTVGNPFYREITWLADRGVSTGWLEADGTRTYRPLDPVNRDAMAAFLFRLANSPAFIAPDTSPFVDVPVTNQFYKEIAWLAQTGVSMGWDEGDGTRTFRPLEPVNRDAMAAFMYRFRKAPPYEVPQSSPFVDVAVQTEYFKEISWLAEEGISSGWVESDGARTYRPLEPVARDAMAAFMYRLLNGGV
uniref:peptidoglycan DD-metalloendopeptidase family protein n=1 Tax=Herbiconiux sp. SYSU D00978 TaxID=2812562 RepID=UPI0027DE21E5|nr:peptidoglycan DD-metalloendopeptidase family protein [Herbiconiux sp. SYSU D00978]